MYTVVLALGSFCHDVTDAMEAVSVKEIISLRTTRVVSQGFEHSLLAYAQYYFW
jgi:hypothetical protein